MQKITTLDQDNDQVKFILQKRVSFVDVFMCRLYLNSKSACNNELTLTC